jgi:hypothetical protein
MLRSSFPLQTTQGMLTFDEVLRKAGRVEYVKNERDYLQMELKAQQEGVVLVRAWWRSEHQLLSALERVLPDGVVCSISPSDFQARFSHKVKQYSQREKALIQLAEEELRLERCLVEFVDGEDPDEMATLDMGDKESIDRFLTELEEDPEAEATELNNKRLLLNRENPLIEKMVNGAISAQSNNWIRMIYHFAVLSAREVPTAGERRRFTRRLIAMWQSKNSL